MKKICQIYANICQVLNIQLDDFLDFKKCCKMHIDWGKKDADTAENGLHFCQTSAASGSVLALSGRTSPESCSVAEVDEAEVARAGAGELRAAENDSAADPNRDHRWR